MCNASSVFTYSKYTFWSTAARYNHLFLMFTVTRKRRRRIRIVRRTGIETGGRTGTGVEMKENAPPVRKRRVRTRSEIETASLIVRKETLRYVWLRSM